MTTPESPAALLQGLADEMRLEYEVKSKRGIFMPWNRLREYSDKLHVIAASLEGQVEDAARYKALRTMCCSEEGPSEATARAWMMGDESLCDIAIDAARTAKENESNDH